MAQNYTWPASSSANASVGVNGSPIPLSSTLIAGTGPTGNETPVSVTTLGEVNVVVTGSALPTGSATAANQVLEIAQLTGIHSDTTSLDGKTVHVDTGAVVVASSALPAGASTSALQTTGNTSLGSIDTKLSSQATAAKQDTGNTSLASLDGKTVHVDTGAVVIASSALPSGGSTAALQTTGNTSLASIDTKTPALGQALAAGSVPVVLTASQLTTLTPLTTIAATQSGTWNVTNVSGTVSLPTGASTSALQTTGNTSVASIDTKTPALGQALAAASVPVVLTAAQITTLTPLATVNAKAATPTALTITQKAITVGTSAVRLTVSGSAPAATRVSLVANADSASTAKFYVGSSSVTNTSTNRGPQFVAGQCFIANNDAGDYYIISDTASQTVYVMEQA